MAEFESLFSRYDRLVLFDTETTGLQFSRDEIIEFAAIVVENRGGSLLVSAAAGSGKTKVLVDRLFRYILEERCNVDDFLIITYTKAAAAELRGRIAAELSKPPAVAGLSGGHPHGGCLLHFAAAGEYSSPFQRG